VKGFSSVWTGDVGHARETTEARSIGTDRGSVN
jgi:hypothetical protein